MLRFLMNQKIMLVLKGIQRTRYFKFELYHKLSN